MRQVVLRLPLGLLSLLGFSFVHLIGLLVESELGLALLLQRVNRDVQCLQVLGFLELLGDGVLVLSESAHWVL
jgi:hypothetical protein